MQRALVEYKITTSLPNAPVSRFVAPKGPEKLDMVPARYNSDESMQTMLLRTAGRNEAANPQTNKTQRPRVHSVRAVGCGNFRQLAADRQRSNK